MAMADLARFNPITAMDQYQLKRYIVKTKYLSLALFRANFFKLKKNGKLVKSH